MKKFTTKIGANGAFTLAEVLITLAVIGIVAALTIGVFLPKIHSTIRARQIAVAETKFTKAMEQMALNNAIGPYYENTQEFVDELQNYLKVSKVCDNEHLEDCFGYEKIKAGEEEFEIKNLKSGKDDFGMNGSGTDYGETIGIITIDGTSMLLSWDKNCPILEPKVYPWGNNTNETTSCVAMVMDVNTDKSPNTLNKDVALFRANRVGQICGMKFRVGGTSYCWGTPFVDTPLLDADCSANKAIYGITNCVPSGSAVYASSYSNQDYWGGTKKICAEQGKRLLNSEELATLAKHIYGTNDIVDYGDTTSALNDTNSGISLNTTTLANTMPIISAAYASKGFFCIWSNTAEDYMYAYARCFHNNSTSYGTQARFTSTRFGICTSK